MIADVLKGSATFTVIEADALAVLQQIPDASVDAVLTDPPYSSGGAFRGDRIMATGTKYVSSGVEDTGIDFAGDNRDQRAHAYWSCLWLGEALRVLRPSGVVMAWARTSACTGSSSAMPRDRVHQTEKPLAVLRELVKIVPRGGVLLDPFAGSGTTGVAALLEGRRCIMVERVSHYAELARARCAASESGADWRNPKQATMPWAAVSTLPQDERS